MAPRPRLQRRVALRRKLHLLRTLANSKSVKKSCIVMDAFIYILKLKLQIEAIKREYQYHSNNIQEVKVDAVGRRFAVKVSCKKEQGLLVSVLEALKVMNLRVIQASISGQFFFAMNAIVEGEELGCYPSADDVTQAILKAIQKSYEIQK